MRAAIARRRHRAADVHLREELRTNKPRLVAGRRSDPQRLEPVPADDAEKENGLEEIGYELAHFGEGHSFVGPCELSVAWETTRSSGRKALRSENPSALSRVTSSP
jgi:hypothetical protein